MFVGSLRATDPSDRNTYLSRPSNSRYYKVSRFVKRPPCCKKGETFSYGLRTPLRPPDGRDLSLFLDRHVVFGP